jgi:DNA ligase (NAD+)
MNKDKITEYLDRASEAYYTGQPIISDDEFDRLADLVSYTRVGSQTSGVKHLRRMYSLQKHYEDEGAHPLKDYRGEIVSTPKLDGAAISALYVGGNLVRVLTRGDGIEGVDITDKFLSSRSLLPHTVDVTTTFQVTGEVVAPTYIENARNYAAGALNLKDLAEFNTRAIDFFAYGLFGVEGINPRSTFTKDMQKLEAMGIKTVFQDNIHNIYPCDGVVHRIDSNVDFAEWGFTGKHPLGAYALKVRQEAVETTILDVEWQVGKTGKVTPVAILEPVMIGDATISRATLNNPGFIEMLGIQIGDRVAIIRSGEIIPKILHKVDA